MAPIKVAYHFPRIGLLETNLYKESSEVFDLLSNVGEIRRLKNLDHLGIVRRASEGAHHPKWEYIVLIWKLIDLVRNNVQEAKLSSALQIYENITYSSGQEFLKTLTLLLNIGHLHWTFTAEKALLAECQAPELGSDLLRHLPFRAIRKLAARTIADEDVYNFYKIIAVHRAARLTRGDQSLNQLVIWTLRCHLIETGQNRKLSAMLSLYQKLRSLAYLILDPAYTPALVSIDANEIFANPRVLADVLFYSDKQFRNLIEAMQQHMYETVYVAAATARESSAVLPPLRALIRRDRVSGFDYILEKLVNGTYQTSASGIAEVNLRPIVRLQFRLDSAVNQNHKISSGQYLPMCRPIAEEASWTANLDRNQVTASIWSFPDRIQKVLDVFARGSVSSNTISKIFNFLLLEDVWGAP